MNDVFLDTSYAIAIASKNDSLHQQSRSLAKKIKKENVPIVTTQAVLLEIGNALSKSRQRKLGIDLLESIENNPNTKIIPITNELYEKTFALFRDRTDKEWGLVDCVSFVVMRDHQMSSALTADEHFIQAGFRALLRED